jgi:eukaryotic-like serine/threonine-protein kinase
MAIDATRWACIKTVFGEALERTGGDRQRYLDAACGNDDALRSEVESLLRSNDRAGDFIETPALFTTGVVADQPLPDRRIGHYRLERELGRGGMGTVFLGVRADDEYQKQVAIKVIKRGMDTDEIVARFRRERQTLATLDHPNIARLLDGGTTAEGLPYFVMEFVEGQPLDDYCAVHALAPDDRLRLFRVVCGAVQYAHRNLVVHRDLKPENILVTPDGTPKLLDFGIAKLLGAESEPGAPAATRPADRLLTLDYASPEQLRGDPVSTASDVFSLGVMLYELLSGQHPFRRPGRSAYAVETAICEEAPAPPSAVATDAGLRNQLAGDLDTIVLTAISKEPARRYGSALELDEDIRHHLEGLPVAARGAAFAYRASKFVRRHRAAVAAGVLTAASLVAGLVGVAWQARVAQVERDRARLEADKAERVSAVLQQMLRAPDPSIGSREITVAQVLNEASRRASIELKDQPEVRGSVRAAIGNTFYSLGLYDRAAEELEEALAVARQSYGDHHLDTVHAQVSLAHVRMEQGQLDESEREYRAALVTLDALGIGEADDRAAAINGLGMIAARRGQTDVAVAHYREALAMRRRLHGDNAMSVAEVMNNLAVQAQGRADLAEAESLYRDVLRIVTMLRGERDPGYATALSNLANVLHSQEKLDEAGTLYERTLDLRHQMLGADHPDVTFTQFNYSELLLQRGEYQRARELAESIVARRGKTLPDRHPIVPAAMITIGRARMALGDVAGAEQTLRGALALRREILPPDHWLTANTESVLGEALLVSGRLGEAETLLTRSYERLLADRGPTHERTRDARARLARLYRDTGRADRADSLKN